MLEPALSVPKVRQQFCTFFLHDMLLGIEVSRVQEILRYQEITPVALAPQVICGLINLRGQIVTAIDLRLRLEFPARDNSRLPTNVVVQTEDGTVSLLVDEIGDVVEIDQEFYEDLPETLTGVDRDLIKGVFKLKDRLLLVLDTERAVNIQPAANYNRPLQKVA